MKRVVALLCCSLVGVLGAKGQVREEVVELRSEDCTLQGTLMLPGSGADHTSTVALLISNSPTADRDGNERVMRNYALKMVANTLARSGIASMRYDKRGVGPSRYNMEGIDAHALSIHARDVQNLVASLSKRFAKVVVVGHGQGAILGMIALSRGTDAAGFISIEGMGRSFDQVLKDQLAYTPPHIRDMAYSIIDTLKTGSTVANVPVFLSSYFAPQLQSSMISAMKYNPQLLIRALNVPLLIVHGDTDIMIRVEDARLLNAANPSSKLVVVAGMNHVLKECPSLERNFQIPTYANPALPLHPGLGPELVRFIKKL